MRYFSIEVAKNYSTSFAFFSNTPLQSFLIIMMAINSLCTEGMETGNTLVTRSTSSTYSKSNEWLARILSGLNAGQDTLYTIVTAVDVFNSRNLPSLITFSTLSTIKGIGRYNFTAEVAMQAVNSFSDRYHKAKSCEKTLPTD